jgi:hypothetical protein
MGTKRVSDRDLCEEDMRKKIRMSDIGKKRGYDDKDSCPEHLHSWRKKARISDESDESDEYYECEEPNSIQNRVIPCPLCDSLDHFYGINKHGRCLDCMKTSNEFLLCPNCGMIGDVTDVYIYGQCLSCERQYCGY